VRQQQTVEIRNFRFDSARQACRRPSGLKRVAGVDQELLTISKQKQHDQAKSRCRQHILLVALLCGYVTGTPQIHAAEAGSPTTPVDAAAQIAHGRTLFISYGCGWCHEDGGRKAGRCPQLMDTQRDDNFIVSRIAAGSPGKMPTFGEGLTAADIQSLLVYIRSLKPEGSP
jgi:cytochrome c553